LRSLRSYGWEDERRVSTTAGFNSRLDELQAAVLDVLLDHLDDGNRERALIAAEYRRALEQAGDDGGLGLPDGDRGSAYYQFAIEVPDRDRFRAWLLEKGVGTGVHYPVGLHEQPAFAADAPADGLPVTECLSDRFVSLPIQPEVVGGQASWIAETVAMGVMRCAVS
jgi:dTDP-4-amino-4,6-dideoxygalactose transaminase